LVAVIRGAILPYFDKQSENRAYSPQEEKGTVLRGFPVMTRVREEEKEPVRGLFSLSSHTFEFKAFPNEWCIIHYA